MGHPAKDSGKCVDNADVLKFFEIVKKGYFWAS